MRNETQHMARILLAIVLIIPACIRTDCIMLIAVAYLANDAVPFDYPHPAGLSPRPFTQREALVRIATTRFVLVKQVGLRDPRIRPEGVAG